MKRILSVVLFISLLASDNAFAQLQPQFTHYGFNGMYISPGYAGMGNATEFMAIHRQQWYGYEGTVDDNGSPVSTLFNASIPVRALKGGLGVTFVSDELANTTINYGQLSYSYHIPVGAGKLGVGVQGIVTNIGKGGAYRVIDIDDPKIPIKSSDTKVDAGAGLWYQGDKLYVGAGISNLLGAKYEFENDYTDIGGDKTTVTGEKHIQATAGYNIDASASVVVTPMAIVKTDLNNTSVEGGVRATFNEKFWVGANYRHEEAISGLAGIGLLKDNALKLGFAYDFTISERDAKETSSYEIMLMYRIPQSALATKPAIRTPRYSF